MCPRRKNQFPLNRKYKIANLQQKFRATRYTHLQQLVCVDHQLSLSSIYSLSSNTLMRPVGRGGVRDGNAVLAGTTVTSSFQTLSAVCSGKIVVFIQYTISIQYRFYGNPVYTFQCLVLIKTHRGQVRQVRSVKCLHVQGYTLLSIRLPLHLLSRCAFVTFVFLQLKLPKVSTYN